MASDKPDSIEKWRHSVSSPVTVTASRFAELVLEQGLRVIGPDSDGYKYCALETEDGYDLYRAPDVVWDKLPVLTAVTADPAAGSDPAAVTVAAGKRIILLGCYVSMTADANAANRYIQLVVARDGTNIDTAFQTVPAHTANLTRAHSFSPGSSPNTALRLVNVGSLPEGGLEIPAGGTFQITVDGIQAGDDLTAVYYAYKEAPA